jgi:hypothetical protein
MAESAAYPNSRGKPPRGRSTLQAVSMTDARRPSFKERAMTEATDFFYVLAYVWLLLAIFGLHKSLVLTEEHIVARQGLILLKAVAFAKIIFVAEEFNLGERFAKKPLIWPILFKSALFAALLIGFDLGEQAIVNRFWPRLEREGGDAISLRHLQTVALSGGLAFASLIPFFAMREMNKVIGAGNMRELLFYKRRQFAPVAEGRDWERCRDMDETGE